MLISRRGFGQLALAGLAAGSRAFAASKVPVAVQLYSVRDLGQKNLAEVLAQVKKLGYTGVEFAGYYGNDAKTVRKMLDANGLKVAGTHVLVDALRGDKLAQTLEFERTIGNKNLIVPWYESKTVEGWKKFGAELNEISSKVKPQGFTVGYHNHAHEFKAIDGQLPIDVVFAAAPDIKVQLDVGHARRAGYDPVKFINDHKGKVVSIHIKEYSPEKEGAVLGEGVVDWKGVFSSLEKHGGIEWYIIEEEGPGCSTSYKCIDTAFTALKKVRS